MEEQLSRILEKALRLAEQTGEFVMEQAPDLLREFYLWHTTKYSIGIALCFIIIVLLYKLPFWMSRSSESYETFLYKNKHIYYGAAIGFWGFGTIISLICLIINIYTLTYLLIAPKLYLIEYFIH